MADNCANTEQEDSEDGRHSPATTAEPDLLEDVKPWVDAAAALVGEAVGKACAEALGEISISDVGPPLISLCSNTPPTPPPRPSRSPSTSKHIEFSADTQFADEDLPPFPDEDLCYAYDDTNGAAASDRYQFDSSSYGARSGASPTHSDPDYYPDSSDKTLSDPTAEGEQPITFGFSESPKCMSVLWNSRRCLSDQGVNGLNQIDFVPPLNELSGVRNPAAERAYRFALESSKFEKRVENLRQQHQALTGILKPSQGLPPQEGGSCSDMKSNSQRSVRFAIDPQAQGVSTSLDHAMMCSRCTPKGTVVIEPGGPTVTLTDLARFPRDYEAGSKEDRDRHFAKTGAYLFHL